MSGASTDLFRMAVGSYLGRAVLVVRLSYDYGRGPPFALNRERHVTLLIGPLVDLYRHGFVLLQR
jgi:hypothetical protein